MSYSTDVLSNIEANSGPNQRHCHPQNPYHMPLSNSRPLYLLLPLSESRLGARVGTQRKPQNACCMQHDRTAPQALHSCLSQAKNDVYRCQRCNPCQRRRPERKATPLPSERVRKRGKTRKKQVNEKPNSTNENNRNNDQRGQSKRYTTTTNLSTNLATTKNTTHAPPPPPLLAQSQSISSPPPPRHSSLTLGPMTAAFCMECLLRTSSLVPTPGPRAPGAGDAPPETVCDSTGIGGGWRLGPDRAV